MTRSRATQTVAVLGALAYAALTLAGCAPGPGSDTGSAAPTDVMKVGLTEWRIATSSAALTAGTDRIAVTNTGSTAHDLMIIGGGVHAHTPELVPGAAAILTIRTQPGATLLLVCDLPGHEAAGMHTTVDVIR